jgi:hypothetical protein
MLLTSVPTFENVPSALVAVPWRPGRAGADHHRLAALEVELEFVDQQVLDHLSPAGVAAHLAIAHLGGAAVGRRDGGGGGIRVKIVVLPLTPLRAAGAVAAARAPAIHQEQIGDLLERRLGAGKFQLGGELGDVDVVSTAEDADLHLDVLDLALVVDPLDRAAPEEAG